MLSVSQRKVTWFLFQEFKQHQKSYTIAAVLFGVVILLCLQRSKPPRSEEKHISKENENLEDELNDLGDDEPVNTNGNNLGQALNGILHCLIHENNGVMDKRCIRRFRELLPGSRKNKEELVGCAVKSFKECTRPPKEHELSICILAFKTCIINFNNNVPVLR